MRRLSPIMAILLTILLVPLAAWAAPQRHTLPNGLKVITSENHEAPVVSFQVWVRAGSIYEKKGEYGITHLIEHMIFKGTPRRPAGQMASEIEALGGEVNAYTTFDHTNYYVTAASASAGPALDILADAVVGASFDQAELTKEKEVVIEEIRMNQNNPSRRMGWEVFAQAFGDSPYGRPIIGSVASVRAISRQDILDYRARWYRAPGMLVVAVGDFKTAEILPLIAKAFAPVSNQPAPAFKLPPDPRALGPRLKIMRDKVSQASISMVWLTPGLPDPVVYALDMAATVLGDGETSRLYSRLKEKQGLVDSANASAYTPEGVGLFEVEASLAPDKVEGAWPAMLQQAMTLATQPPSGEELKRARVNLAAGFVRARQTMQGQARELGYFEMFRGGFEHMATYMQRFNAVDVAAVADTARRWLSPAGLSVVIQVPEGAKVPDLAALKKAAMAAYTQAPAKAAPDQPQRVVLDNGLTLLIKPARAVPLVSYLLAAPGGQAAEGQGQAGLYSLWSRAVERGTKDMSYEELTRELEDMAGSVSGYSSKTSAGLSGSFLAQDWKRGLELLAKVWTGASFPADQVERAKKEQLAALRAQENSPVSRAFKRFRRLVYGEHPFGHDPLGTPETLAKLGPEQLKAAMGRMRGPGGCVLAVVGDVDPQAFIAEVKSLLGGLKGQAAQVTVPPLTTPAQPKVEKIDEPQAKQSQIMLGFVAPGLESPERWPLELADAVLGGMGGRLFEDLRDKRSLAYAVQPFYSPAKGGGIFGIYMGVGPGKEQAALAGIGLHLGRMQAQAPSPKEMARAKAYYLGGYAIGLQSYASQATAMAGGELNGLGWLYYTKVPEFVKAVSAEQVLATVKKYLNPEHRAELIAGPPPQKEAQPKAK
ncbi:MAG: insulinase family protein [Desulfarculus sp.]|nr:insulinase family protein [Pseudomonadota bacterium]MBV1714949.1 insulinase family protein [Desulfarculus sp.]MBU4575233.1 insulinase family protein [Pseudomonadota bacterium]MBU4598998.1 insulinase family protein [Pseudomonadota bacterium]MBV1737449.1 insulinase family protein [Desulfarculus sp.]